mmetsp:Transcript_95595/g.227711  ORF Transcript_95595/g.227711 Transcript_95595/m.227711 type:complete len:229 (+) Transcript_95595:909-1595(+)
MAFLALLSMPGLMQRASDTPLLVFIVRSLPYSSGSRLSKSATMLLKPERSGSSSGHSWAGKPGTSAAPSPEVSSGAFSIDKRKFSASVAKSRTCPDFSCSSKSCIFRTAAIKLLACSTSETLSCAAFEMSQFPSKVGRTTLLACTPRARARSEKPSFRPSRGSVTRTFTRKAVPRLLGQVVRKPRRSLLAKLWPRDCDKDCAKAFSAAYTLAKAAFRSPSYRRTMSRR